MYIGFLVFGARLSVPIPAVTKSVWSMNTEQQSELKVFPREQSGEKNGREKSLCSEFKLKRNGSSFAETQIEMVTECLIS